jgi:transcriptional regulator with XRE-family HTH domain
MNVNIDGHFGQVLKVQRRVRKITQAELAAKVDLDKTYISMLERGLRKPSLEVTINLAKALEIPAIEIVSEVESLSGITEIE